jgi:hypothetical protein
MNTYAKYCPNVWVAKCQDRHEKGASITLTTKWGQEHECEVWNFLFERDGYFYHSITRKDGYNSQERAKAKAERLMGWAVNAEKRGEAFYNASNKDAEFLRLGEPIKVGHHSENRHRKIIDQAHNNMGKYVQESDKAEKYEGRAEYWKKQSSKIDLSMPESLEYFEYLVEKRAEYHEGLKSGRYPKEHTYSLTYAKKALNEAMAKLETAKKLWA